MRAVFDGGREYPFLSETFAIMRTSSASGVSSWGARKTRRQERLRDRPHPFPAFRPQPDEEEEEKPEHFDHDTLSSVAHYFDAVTLQAKCLRSDGSFSYSYNF